MSKIEKGHVMAVDYWGRYNCAWKRSRRSTDSLGLHSVACGDVGPQSTSTLYSPRTRSDQEGWVEGPHVFVRLTTAVYNTNYFRYRFGISARKSVRGEFMESHLAKQ